MTHIQGPVLLVGCGKMGGAMLRGWLSGGLAADDAYGIDPQGGCRESFSSLGAHMFADASSLPAGLMPKALILAVKPQMMDEVLPHLRDRIGADTVVISIAAGTMIASIEAAFPAGTSVIRVMPNTPAAIGRGVSVICANPHATEAQKQLATRLSEVVGAVHWIDDEDHMHAVTGLSGSGPAYVFHMIEAMTAAGIKSGLPEALSAQLARDTIAGAGALAFETGENPAQLRINVTSPNGTTQAGLETLMAPETGLQTLMEKTVASATRRSRELAEI